MEESRADVDLARAPVSGHLWQIDIVRLLTFAAVIAVHSLAFTETPSNRVAAGAMMLLQFGREVFFALTAFVLVYSVIGRPMQLRRFWGRRVTYVAVPYVAWSAIYFAYSVLGPQHLQPSIPAFANDLLYGGAEYHLYFLLVTIQLYLIFPLVLRFVRRTAHRAGPVLLLVVAANLTWLAVVQWVPAPAGGARWFWVHAYELLPSYSMYVLAGCYAAIHLARIQTFVQTHRAALLALAATAAVGATAAYVAQLPSMAPRDAAAVLQPATLLSCLAATIVLYIVGSSWAAGPRHGAATITTLSDASFGVYLAHPLVLQILLDHGLGNNGQKVPAVLATIIGFVAAAAGGVAVSVAARRTPLSLALTGRPRMDRPAVSATPVRPATAVLAAAHARPVSPGSQQSPNPILEPVHLRRRG